MKFIVLLVVVLYTIPVMAQGPGKHMWKGGRKGVLNKTFLSGKSTVSRGGAPVSQQTQSSVSRALRQSALEARKNFFSKAAAGALSASALQELAVSDENSGRLLAHIFLQAQEKSVSAFPLLIQTELDKKTIFRLVRQALQDARRQARQNTLSMNGWITILTDRLETEIASHALTDKIVADLKWANDRASGLYESSYGIQPDPSRMYSTPQFKRLLAATAAQRLREHSLKGFSSVERILFFKTLFKSIFDRPVKLSLEEEMAAALSADIAIANDLAVLKYQEKYGTFFDREQMFSQTEFKNLWLEAVALRVSDNSFKNMGSTDQRDFIYMLMKELFDRAVPLGELNLVFLKKEVNAGLKIFQQVDQVDVYREVKKNLNTCAEMAAWEASVLGETDPYELNRIFFTKVAEREPFLHSLPTGVGTLGVWDKLVRFYDWRYRSMNR